MLLPSDVARLVLGYLQEEGLSATSRAFIHESPNLREYADHTAGDGAIPACVFSLFGKGLTTILNEYVAVKTKESRHEVPAVMTSLWKKLDFTLNQIKSLQNSPSISACQRVRSRVEMANMARQRTLTLMPAGGAVVCSSVPETGVILSPALTTHSALGHSTPVSSADPHIRPALGNSMLSTPRDSPVHIVVSEHRLNPGPMSPGRRKWDTPRKRSGALTGTTGQGRPAAASSSLNTEAQAEEVVDENFPQLVIQSARDKILGDRSLQEKLAENINKILKNPNEPAPQTSRASVSTVEEDQSIDEILGLQGEIHMSDDAIHDILEQTESDPAFQALFDLFDCNKNKFTDGDGDDDMGSIPEASDAAGPSASVRPAQSDSQGAAQTHTAAPDGASTTQKMRPGQERKNRKTAAPMLLKKVFIPSNGRSSRIENSSARMLVNPAPIQSVPSAAEGTNKTEKASLLNNCTDITPIDLDEPLNTPPPPVDSTVIQEPVTKNSTATGSAQSVSASTASSKDPAVIAIPEVTSVSNTDKKQETKGAQPSKEQRPAAASAAVSSRPVFLSPAPVQLNNALAQTTNLVETVLSSSKTFSTSAPTGAAAPLLCPPTATILDSTASASTSTTPTATPAWSTPAPSCPLDVVAPPASAANPSTVSKAPADSSDIVSLKIIVSDNHEEDSSSDTALNQAISSITGDKLPTIYLSSPAKSPGAPSTPRANSDEAAQAVSGLQNSEVHASPLGYKAAALIASSSTGTSQAQPNYIIQLPLDASNPALQGGSASYFLVAEPPTPDLQTTQMLLPAGVTPGQPLPASQYGLNTQPQTQAFSSGSALILPSPVKPMMLPVSVLGQNTVANVQMVSNQLVAIPKPAAVQQTETVKPKPPAGKTKQSAAAGGKKIASKKVHQSAAGSSHRRILCFEPQAAPEPQTGKARKTTTPATPNKSTSQTAQQPEKDSNQSVSRTKPAILGGSKPKRRVETVRCSDGPLTGGSFDKEFNPFQHQKDVRKSSRKQDHSSCRQESSCEEVSSTGASQPETVKKTQSEKRSKSIDRKHHHDSHNDALKGKDADRSRSLSSDSAPKSGSKKDKEDGGRKEPADKPSKSREGRPEKKAPLQTVPNVTANKENEMKGSVTEQNQQSAPSSSAARDFSPSTVDQPTSSSQSKAAKAPSKTSSLAKQAAEMLQDIQGLNSPSTPPKKPGGGSSELSLPVPGCNQETPADCPGTPSLQKKGKTTEGTPKHLLPPNTPDVPTCSPASEAGSESSINMAAHTLMILSRAAIARTGTPLKDSLRQEGAGEKSPAGSKVSKKRKQSPSTSSPPPKKEAKQSPSKKKDRERKKLMDCFPLDLDVDKFLSSLHYDE
ncbi:protein NPAT [Salarias fasciatus]|uniref:protein NPAT n=1 Tax=Salarias fasciatus TaxID=181472 RepID=UPI001176786B|nr:protein NPAT [Salarias fasciatus]